MLAGVTVVDPATTWVDVTVTFEPGRDGAPRARSCWAPRISPRAPRSGPNSRLTDTRVGAGARVDNTVADGAEVGAGASVGPYAYLRPGTRLGAKAKAGTYVEMKNADDRRGHEGAAPVLRGRRDDR